MKKGGKMMKRTFLVNIYNVGNLNKRVNQRIFEHEPTEEEIKELITYLESLPHLHGGARLAAKVETFYSLN